MDDLTENIDEIEPGDEAGNTSEIGPDDELGNSIDEIETDEESGEPFDDVDAGDELALKELFEAVLFLSNEPLSVSFFVKNFGVDPTQSRIILDSLVDEYEERDSGIKIIEISRGYQFVTNQKYAERIRRVMNYKKKETLSKGMLETLSIIAYKQPILLAEIEELRGVSSRMMVASLMKKNLIKPVGRKELPGRPLLYGTTDNFLRYFGLNKLSDLPKLSEIKELTYDTEE